MRGSASPESVERVTSPTEDQILADDDGIIDLRIGGSPLSSKFAENLRELFWTFGAPKLVLASLGANLRRHVSDANEVVFYRNAKKFCEFFSARLLGTPCDPIKLFGHLKTWTSSRLFRGGARNLRDRVSLSEGIFKAKALIGHATDYATMVSLRKHRQTAASSVPDDSTVDELFDAVEPLVDHMMGGLRQKFETYRPVHPPASTGSTESGRTVQGKAGRLLRAFHGVRAKGRDVPLAWDLFRSGSPLRLDVESTQFTPSGTHQARFDHASVAPDSGVLLEDPVVKSGVELTPEGTVERVIWAEYPLTEQKWAAFSLTEALRDIESGESRKVKVTAVQEAGAKVRTVTSGSAAGAYVAKVWQEDVMAEMRKLPCFPSMSGQITALEVTRLLEGCRLAGSSDFCSATDLLNPTLTNRILAKLVDGFVAPSVIMDDNADKVLTYPWEPLSPKGGYPKLCLPTGEELALLWPKFRGPVRRVWIPRDACVRCQVTKSMSAWYPAWRYFGVKEGDFVALLPGHYPTVTKTCGQLMGQTTSFVLLCLVNVACCLAAHCRLGSIPDSERWWWKVLKTFIINGDDRLARTSRGLEDAFWALASPVGLKRSPGKSHEHPDVCCINSQVYVRSGPSSHLGMEIWERVPVVRSGLLFGIKKLKQDVFRPSVVVTALFETVAPKAMQRTISCFLRLWGSTLQDELEGRNLFLPVSLNGMGQVPPDAWKWHLTPFQHRVASDLMAARPHLDYSFGPHWPSPPVVPPRSHPWSVPTDPWDTGSLEHELAQFDARRSQLIADRRVKSKIHAVGCPGPLWAKMSVDVSLDPISERPRKRRANLDCCGHIREGESFVSFTLESGDLRGAVRPTLCWNPCRSSTGTRGFRSIHTWQGKKIEYDLVAPFSELVASIPLPPADLSDF
jgi:hypothetical protein